MILSSPTSIQPAQDIYLPIIEKPPVYVVSSATLEEARNELELALLIRFSPLQQRENLWWSSALYQAARRQAQSMADRGYFSHVDPEGFGPNYWAYKAGFRFPDSYNSTDLGVNYIESLSAGQSTAQKAWDALIESPSHSQHLLGKIPFYKAQTWYAVGYVFKEESIYKYYYSVMIAQANEMNSGE